MPPPAPAERQDHGGFGELVVAGDELLVVVGVELVVVVELVVGIELLEVV